MKHKSTIVGSTAMKYHFPDFPREPKDTDVICTIAIMDLAFFYAEKQDLIDFYKVKTHSGIIKYKDIQKPVEYLFSDDQKSLAMILDHYTNDEGYITPEALYSLKKAHIHFPVKFDKHIQDLMFLREKLRHKLGISLDTDLNSETDLLDHIPALTELHFKETERRVGKLKTPKMDKTTEEFFGKSKNYVTSYYVHDNMHKAIAEIHQGTPVYLEILKAGSEVETDSKLWQQLTINAKIWCVLEEVYVIALERKILPQMFEINPIKISAFGMEFREWTPKEAFDWALFRVCTTLCDGFFREFAVRAYDEIQKQYNPDYIKKFFENIDKYENNYREEN